MRHLIQIKSYLQQVSRNKIVFCKERLNDIEFINIGKELSQIMVERRYVGYETVMKELLAHIKVNSEIGRYVAIENIGILFEPELKIDVKTLLDANSINQCLIICTEANISNNALWYIMPEDGIQVNLQGLSYIKI